MLWSYYWYGLCTFHNFPILPQHGLLCSWIFQESCCPMFNPNLEFESVLSTHFQYTPKRSGFPNIDPDMVSQFPCHWYHFWSFWTCTESQNSIEVANPWNHRHSWINYSLLTSKMFTIPIIPVTENNVGSCPNWLTTPPTVDSGPFSCTRNLAHGFLPSVSKHNPLLTYCGHIFLLSWCQSRMNKLWLIEWGASLQSVVSNSLVKSNLDYMFESYFSLRHLFLCSNFYHVWKAHNFQMNGKIPHQINGDFSGFPPLKVSTSTLPSLWCCTTWQGSLVGALVGDRGQMWQAKPT